MIAPAVRDSAAAHCKRVGLRNTKALATYHGVTTWTVNWWYRTNRELFDRKLAEAATGRAIVTCCPTCNRPL